MTSGWRIGTIFGIPLLLNPTWFYSLGLFAFFFSSDWEQADLEPGWAWLAGFVMALLLFTSVLLHELGHSVVAQSQGIEVSAITLFPFGGIASISQESKTPSEAFRVAIAGPAVSFALFLLLLLLSFGLPEASPVKTMLSYLAGINLVLALFNMLPGLPLDGGQVLKAVIWKVTGSRIKGVRFAAQTGELLGWAAIGVGMAGFLSTLRFSFLWLVLLGWFGIRRAIAYRRQTTLQKAMLQLQVADAMRTDFQADETNRIQPLLEHPTVTEFASLAEAIDQLEAQQRDRLFVLSSVGAVIGVIDRADIVQALGTQLNLSVPETVLQQIKADGQFPANLQLQSVARDALK
jgi:Zn-dependent protease